MVEVGSAVFAERHWRLGSLFPVQFVNDSLSEVRYLPKGNNAVIVIHVFGVEVCNIRLTCTEVQGEIIEGSTFGIFWCTSAVVARFSLYLTVDT